MSKDVARHIISFLGERDLLCRLKQKCDTFNSDRWIVFKREAISNGEMRLLKNLVYGHIVREIVSHSTNGGQTPFHFDISESKTTHHIIPVIIPWISTWGTWVVTPGTKKEVWFTETHYKLYQYITNELQLTICGSNRPNEMRIYIVLDNLR